MARKFFNWSNFSLTFLKAIVYSQTTPATYKPETVYNDKDFLIPYIDGICEYPDDKFINTYRREIEEYFLPEGKHLKSVISRLGDLNYGDILNMDRPDLMDFNDKEVKETALLNLKQKNLSQTLINVYLKELVSVGLSADEIGGTNFPKPVPINLKDSQLVDEVRLYPYQEDAVNAMKNYFLKDNGQSGILQMPTGSGKTLTSIYFLLKEMASQGYQIIWLAHRFMLVEQAASVFYKLAPLIKEGTDTPPKTFKMICISSEHSSAKALEKDDDLIISMVQSLNANRDHQYVNLKRLKKCLHKKVIIVVDEAHHTLAPTYRRIINEIRKKVPDAKLLGLTATPVRHNDRATAALGKIFNYKIIFSVPMSQLIANGTLSKPIPTSIQTNVDIETIIDEREIAEIQRKKEIPESLVDKIARTNERNDIIVNEYVNHKDKYGKTLIFALNGIHCMALNDALQARGIKSDFVYTLNKGKYNNEVIDRFKNNQLDVLININIFTEGTDIPDIQTIFLTRPTSSDALLMQMVGRGMRGLSAGGTATVNIVDFCDKWSDITRWLNPKIIFGDEEDYKTPEIYVQRNYELIPFDLIRAVMKGISYKGTGVLKRDVALPIGWYNIIDESGNDEQILYFESQEFGFSKLENDLEFYPDKIDNIIANGGSLADEYFNDFGIAPTENELRDLISYCRLENKFPEFQTFKTRDEIDPYFIAEDFLKDNIGVKDMKNKVDEIYKKNRELIDNLYGGREYFSRRIDDFIMYPDGVAPLGTIIEEVRKDFYKLDIEPFGESLDKLLDEVISENSDVLGKNFKRPSITWTNAEYKSYFAVYYANTNKIKINLVLDSKSVSRDVLKFLIYHECLHQLISKHDSEFRNLEHLYPNFEDYENFLDVKFPDFYRDYAM